MECEHKWGGLWPGSELGHAEQCLKCNAGRFVETPRCECTEVEIIRWNRTIQYGYCSQCKEIVRGYEDEITY